MNKKKIIQFILLIVGIIIVMNVFENSYIAMMVIVFGGFYWSISNIEKTYNANFDVLNNQNHEFREQIILLELEIKELHESISFIKNDIDNIQHDIKPLNNISDFEDH